MRDNDIYQRPFAYNFDVFLIFSNPPHVKHIDILTEHSTILTPFVIYHTPVRFSLSCSSIHSESTSSSLPRFVVPRKSITWLSFDSVIHSFGSQLES